MNNIQTFTEINTKNNKKNIWKIIGLLITIFLIIMIIVILKTVNFYKIKGTSMYPTLIENHYVVCTKTDTIKRGDIVAFYKNDSVVIKRVVGLPEEEINIENDGTVLINNNSINEKYLEYKAKGEVELELPYKIEKNSYFVLGDNREDSIDSRHHQIGTLTKDEIICKVKIVL